MSIFAHTYRRATSCRYNTMVRTVVLLLLPYCTLVYTIEDRTHNKTFFSCLSMFNKFCNSDKNRTKPLPPILIIRLHEMVINRSLSSVDNCNEYQNDNGTANNDGDRLHTSLNRILSFSNMSNQGKAMRRRSSNISTRWLTDAVKFKSNTGHHPSGKLNFFQQIVIKASNDEELPMQELIKRSTFIMMCMATVFAGTIWGSMYYVLGELRTATLPFIYALCNGAALLLCSILPGMYKHFVRIQLFLIFFLPCAVHLSLGGLEESGGVFIWSFLAPLGASFYRSTSESLRWLFLYIYAVLALMYIEFHNASHFSHRIQVGYWTMNILGVSAITFSAAFIFAKELEEEYRRSEDLLQNILPKPIAKRIKQGELPIVDNHDEVTILFTDLVGFTKACSTMCPQLLIGSFLLDVFSAFDHLCVNKDLEKIKTIGDAYMVVGGLNKESNQNHAKQVLYLAMEMFHELEKVNAKFDLDFKIRVGVHTGPVIAGVLGVSKFAYGM